MTLFQLKVEWHTIKFTVYKNIAYNTLWIRYNYVNEWEHSLTCIELQKVRITYMNKKIKKTCESKKNIKIKYIVN